MSIVERLSAEVIRGASSEVRAAMGERSNRQVFLKFRIDELGQMLPVGEARGRKMVSFSANPALPVGVLQHDLAAKRDRHDAGGEIEGGEGREEKKQ